MYVGNIENDSKERKVNRFLTFERIDGGIQKKKVFSFFCRIFLNNYRIPKIILGIRELFPKSFFLLFFN